MKKFALSLFAICMAFVAFADNDSELVGKWIQTITQDGVNVISLYDFQEDGTMRQEMTITGQSPKIEIVGSGTCEYTYSGNTITFKFKADDIEFSTFFIEGLDPAWVSMAIEQQKSQLAGQQMKLTKVKIEGNTLTAKMDKETVTFTRIQ